MIIGIICIHPVLAMIAITALAACMLSSTLSQVEETRRKEENEGDSHDNN